MYYEAELHRLKGEVLLTQAARGRGSGTTLTELLRLAEAEPSVLAEVETCFRRSFDVARRQQAKLLELRAAMRFKSSVAVSGQICTCPTAASGDPRLVHRGV